MSSIDQPDIDMRFHTQKGGCSEMEPDGYYFFSEKQKKIREMVDPSPTFFARIGGKVVECTERSSSPKPSGPFDDYKSHGRGVYIGEKPE